MRALNMQTPKRISDAPIIPDSQVGCEELKRRCKRSERIEAGDGKRMVVGDRCHIVIPSGI